MEHVSGFSYRAANLPSLSDCDSVGLIVDVAHFAWPARSPGSAPYASGGGPTQGPRRSRLVLYALLAYIATMGDTLGQAIKQKRLAADYTLRAFAELIQISAAHQSDIEHGRRMPSEAVLRKTAEALKRVGASYEEFLALDSRLGDDLQDMIQSTPEIGQLLRQVKESGRAPRDILRSLQEALRKQEADDADPA